MDTRNFLRPELTFSSIDYRQPKNARKGGWYRLEASRFADPTDAFTFNRFDVDLRQYASILAERRVLAVRLFASTSEPGAGRARAVLSDAVRSADTIRCAGSATTGFADRTRFSRRPSTALKSGRASTRRCSTMPARSPCDAPTSTSRTSKHDYGFGFRFNTDNGTILRIDAGFGSSDGKHLYIVFGDVF